MLVASNFLHCEHLHKKSGILSTDLCVCVCVCVCVCEGLGIGLRALYFLGKGCTT
jgi:hypothetical protein